MHEQYQSCIEACQQCEIECEHCVTACLEEADVAERTHCIKMMRDCADICAQTARWMARDSHHAPNIVQLCADICEDSARHCAKFTEEHCRRCTEAMRKCADACSKMAGMATSR
ncbi:MAG: four-helix bundle copper-binding protein [Firmicutes bacterium]|nr:four-helix bundle copper-binding protein [Bacillota bacterium]